MKLFGNRKDNESQLPLEQVDETLDTEEYYEEDGEYYDEEYYDENGEYCDEEYYDEDGEYYDEEYEDGEYFDEEYEDGEYYDEEYEDAPQEKKRLSKKAKILIGIGAFLLIVIIGAVICVNYILSLINYRSAESSYFKTVSAASQLEEESAVNSYYAELDEQMAAEDLEASPEDLLKWNTELEDITSDSSTYEIPLSDEVFNILLIGTDNRAKDGVGRSDVMMLVSINQLSKKIYLSSFLRDSYVAIPGYGNTRLNHAFAYSGPDLLIETLANNYKVHVDRYVAVDFYSFMDVIDTLNGLFIDVSEEELDVTNSYIWSMNKLLGEDWDTDWLWNTGMQYLNGKQTLAYVRNRYTGSDYERTARQREVIDQLINRALTASPATLVDLCQVILPQVTTDMTKSEILNYAANMIAYMDYEIVQQQIPTAGTYQGATIKGMSVIKIDMEENIEFLRGTVYAGTEYGLPLPEIEVTPEPSPEPSQAPAEESAVEEETPEPEESPAAEESPREEEKPEESPKPSAKIEAPAAE